MSAPRPLTVHEAAARLGVSHPTALRLIHAGHLRAYRTGVGKCAQFRIEPAWVDDFKAAMEHGAAVPARETARRPINVDDVTFDETFH